MSDLNKKLLQIKRAADGLIFNDDETTALKQKKEAGAWDTITRGAGKSWDAIKGVASGDIGLATAGAKRMPAKIDPATGAPVRGGIRNWILENPRKANHGVNAALAGTAGATALATRGEPSYTDRAKGWAEAAHNWAKTPVAGGFNPYEIAGGTAALGLGGYALYRLLKGKKDEQSEQG